MTIIESRALAIGALVCSVALLACSFFFPEEVGAHWFKDRIIASLLILLCLDIALGVKSKKTEKST